jgi:hypothetical protein
VHHYHSLYDHFNQEQNFQLQILIVKYIRQSVSSNLVVSNYFRKCVECFTTFCQNTFFCHDETIGMITPKIGERISSQHIASILSLQFMFTLNGKFETDFS